MLQTMKHAQSAFGGMPRPSIAPARPEAAAAPRPSAHSLFPRDAVAVIYKLARLR